MSANEEPRFRDLGAFAATGTEVEIDGKRYTVSPLGPRDYAKFEAFIRSERLNAFVTSALAGGIDQAEREHLILEIVRSQVDIGLEATTATGTLYLLWLALVKKHPELNLDDVARLVVIEQSLPQIAAAVTEVDSKDPKAMMPR